jgi:hypothetical protein
MRANPQGTWFEAACACESGSVRLCVGVGEPAAAHAAGAAILLHGAQPLLSLMDEWHGADLAWRWVQAPAPHAPGTHDSPSSDGYVGRSPEGTRAGLGAARRSARGDDSPSSDGYVGRSPEGTRAGLGAARRSARTHASARWRGETPQQQCLVSWPWAWLRSMPPPPPALASKLEWPLVDAVLVLAELQVDPAELALLEPGGAVLVPQALQPPWHGSLRGADEAPQASVAVDLSVPWRPRLVARDAPPPVASLAADPARAACELRLDLPLGVSAQRLAGWRREGDAGEIVQLPEAGLRAALWRRGAAGQGAQALAGGRLMPWGDGWALAVETVPLSS